LNLRAERPMVIVGAGLTGGNAAKTLREDGWRGRLTLIGEEPGVPFGRPPLSKTYMRGEEDLSGWLVKPDDWYEKNEVERVKARVVSIDAARRQVTLQSGGVFDYGKLLIATGGRNKPLAVPGADLQGVYQLRTVAECEAIKRVATRGSRAVVVGMGFIGSEVAASLRQLGVHVTAVLRGKAPLDAVLGAEMGEVMAEDDVVRFEGSRRIERATTRKGRRIECDLAIVAVGIEPNLGTLQGTKVSLDNGVLVDSMCRTNVPGIFAAGDVANHLHPVFGRIRVEHYNNAEKQGAAAARSMLGSRAAYRYVHSFWSDQFEHKLEYIGHVRKWDRFVLRGSLDKRKLVGFYLRAGRLKAAVGLNRGGDPELDHDGELAKAGRLIAKGARPGWRALADEDQDLGRL
jgi:3-phenylpropionate/trans-cinnamate dioxygenase ferredoxin reductase subunit